MNTTEFQCPCCERCGPRPHFKGLVRCDGCGHVWDPAPVPQEVIEQVYSEDYFKGDAYSDYELEEKPLRNNFRRRIRELSAMHPRGARLWELGCAYGYFLDEARAHFEVAGCDICEAAVAKTHDRFHLDARWLDFENADIGTDYDVVCMWDTIEHLPRPDRTIEKAARVLRPGGTLALSTGDIGALVARIRGENWRLISPGIHLHYFTAKSMETLLTRFGFGSVQIKHCAFWRGLDSTIQLMLMRRDNRLLRTIHTRLSGSGLLRIGFPINTFDVMTVYATKQ